MSQQQLNPKQIQHAIDNGAKLIAAKQLEIQAYTAYRNLVPGALAALLQDIIPNTGHIVTATDCLFQSKLLRCEVELEELELQVKAYTFMQNQQGNMIQVPSGVKLG